MARTTHVTKEPVILDGYQAVMKPSKYGYSLSAIVDQDLIDTLERERPAALEWAVNKLKNPKRQTLKPEPWEEVSEGQYKIKFSWNDERKPAVVDTEGTAITDEDLPLYSGAQVKLAFYQQGYLLKDGVTLGTTLKLQGVQVVALNTSAGVDTGTEDVAALFGTTEGFKSKEPNVTVKEDTVDEDF